MVSIAALLLLNACGEGEARLIDNGGEDGAEEASSQTSPEEDFGHHHGEAHAFQFDHDDSERVDFEAGAEMLERRVTPDHAFRGVKVMVTAAKLAIDYRVIYSEGDVGEWTPLEAESTHDKFHSGFFSLERAAEALEFRSDTPAEYVRWEFFEDGVDTADEIDDHAGHLDDEDGAHDAEDDGVRHQELAKSGRYVPPSSVDAAGNAQIGNFRYESAPSWSGGSNCSGTFLPGARSLGNFLVDHFDGAAYFQGYNCRQIRGSSGMSMHGTGRAIDVFVPIYHGQADNDLGDPVANYLIENATELGVQFFIWDRAKWSIGYGDRYYGGSHPHHDHLHIELTSGAAASARSSYPGQGPQFNPHFADDDGSVHEAAINEIYSHGITRGCKGGAAPRYCTERTLRRGNMAVLFMRAFNLPRARQDYFDDDDGMHSEAAINALAYRGITMGCDPNDDTKFCPNEEVTRGQLAVFLDRALRLEDTSRDYYNDDNGSYYEDAANRVAKAGITNGCAPGRYCGGESITRGQLASFLARALGYLPGYGAQEVDFVPYFADDDGSIHEDAINTLFHAGITNGCGSGTNDRPNFCPERDLKRLEIGVMIARGFGLADTTTDYFTDDDGTSYEPYLNALADAGITNGCDGGDTFCPQDKASLGAVSLFIMRAAAHTSNGQLDVDGMTQLEAIDELVNWQVIRRPSCADAAQCRGEVPNRAETATILIRVLSRLNLL
jgi:hypothetical protein